MQARILVGAMAAVALTITVAGGVSRVSAQAVPGAGPGVMGPHMMGPGMMGCGSGPMGWGMMGSRPTATQSNLNISVNDVKAYLQRWIAMAGNPRVKVGDITEKDANTITADILTTDKDALVQRFNVDRHTGIYTSVP